MSSDLLNVGTQSVLTAQRQLTTTGHNIANVNTEGYSRQSVIQGANDPKQYGGQTYGMGVHVENVRRSWDQFAVNEHNLTTTELSKKQDVVENLDQLTNMLSSVASRKIPDNINDWFDTLKTLADAPNDVGARKVLLEKSHLITQNLNHFHETVRKEKDNINTKMGHAVERMNSLAVELRDINRLIMRTPGPHNDLMDKQESLVNELSQYTKVTVTTRGSNEGFNIHIGNGDTLVSGTEASQLKMVNGSPDPKKMQLALVEGQGTKVINPKDINGKLGAFLETRDETLPYVMDELGRLATSMSLGVNELQSQGLDLYGQVGAEIFTDVNSEDMAKSRVILGAGSTTDMAVYIDDLSQLKGGEYSVRYDGSTYQVTKPSGETIAVSKSVFANGYTMDGLRIDVKNPPKEGERLLIRPTENAARLMKVEMDDPTQIAAQSYKSSYTNAKGSAEFNILQAGGQKEFQVVVSPKGDQFAILGMDGRVITEPQTYPPKGPVTVNGTVFELTQGAKANDRFAVNLVPSEGDNGNLLKMLSIQTDKVMDDGNTTMLGLYQNLNTDVGLRTSTAIRKANIATLESEAAKERIASISGVNLDEEAANMMKFQQAYMASSRVMQASNDTFNTILALR